MILNTIQITENFKDLDKISSLAIEAFPPEEYLAPSKLIEMAKEDNFDFYALYDGDTFVGFFAIQTYKQLSYLFFLAIDSKLRSGGYGTKAIQTLVELYPNKQQVVDMEMVDENAKNNNQRVKRRSFYLRNGYLPTGYFLSYLGVDYEILCMDKYFDFDTFKKMMSMLKIEGFIPRYFTK